MSKKQPSNFDATPYITNEIKKRRQNGTPS